jgi:hypothetical protein
MSTVENFTIHRCPCRARWIVLTAQGTPDDGLNIGSDLQTAYDLLESEFCSPITARIGDTALAALQRAFREVSGNDPVFSGIRLTRDVSLGSNTVLVIGSPAESHDQERSLDTLLGTLWRLKSSHGTVGRVVAVDETVSNEQTVVLVSPLDPQNVYHCDRSIFDEDFEPAGESLAQASKDLAWIRWQLADEHDPKPLIGETWWNVTTSEPSMVFGFGQTPTGLNHIRTTRDGVNTRHLLDSFTKYYNCVDRVNIIEGAEYVNMQDNSTWILDKATIPNLVLRACDKSGYKVVRVTEFRSAYRQHIRRSALDRLLDDKSLV